VAVEDADAFGDEFIGGAGAGAKLGGELGGAWVESGDDAGLLALDSLAEACGERDQWRSPGCLWPNGAMIRRLDGGGKRLTGIALDA